MSDLKVDCDWRDDTLYIALSKDPERIGVRLFPSRQAPVRRYVPEAELLRLKERYAKLLDEKIDAYNDMRAVTLEADELGAENARLRELVSAYDSALHRLCDQMQGHVECSKCVLGRRFDEDTCALDELRKVSIKRRVEVDE